MIVKKRSEYAEYIGEAIRFAVKQSGIKLPDTTILVVKGYSELSYLDDILGLPIYVMDMPSTYEFFLAFPSACNDNEIQRNFQEYLDLYPLNITEN